MEGLPRVGKQKKPPRCRQGFSQSRGTAAYGSYFRLIAPMPAATFRPLLPSNDTGCRAIDLSRPPTSTFAPTPTPTVALAVAPALVALQGAFANVGRGREHRPHENAALGVADVDAELVHCAFVMLTRMCRRTERAVQVLRRSEDETPAARHVAGQRTDLNSCGAASAVPAKANALAASAAAPIIRLNFFCISILTPKFPFLRSHVRGPNVPRPPPGETSLSDCGSAQRSSPMSHDACESRRSCDDCQCLSRQSIFERLRDINVISRGREVRLRQLAALIKPRRSKWRKCRERNLRKIGVFGEGAFAHRYRTRI